MKKPNRYSEIKAMTDEQLRSLTITTAELSMLYSISEFTLRNWRRGYYFTPKDEGTVKKWFTEAHDRLANIPQHPGQGGNNSVLYKLEWVNDFLRKVGHQKHIPEFMKHI